MAILNHLKNAGNGRGIDIEKKKTHGPRKMDLFQGKVRKEED